MVGINRVDFFINYCRIYDLVKGRLFFFNLSKLILKVGWKLEEYIVSGKFVLIFYLKL